MKCPKCNKGISKVGTGYGCHNKKCDFVCSSEKFDSIIKSLYLKKERSIPQYGDNDEALNNARW